MSDYDLILASLAAVHAKLDTLLDLLELLKVPELDIDPPSAVEWQRDSYVPVYQFETDADDVPTLPWQYSNDGDGTAGLVSTRGVEAD